MNDHTKAVTALMAELGANTPDGQDPSKGLQAIAAIADPAVCELIAGAMADRGRDAEHADKDASSVTA